MSFLSRRPLLLYSYLSTEMLIPFFASFLIMNCVFFLVKLIPFLNAVLDLNIGLADFIRLFSYLFPNMFLYSIPMSAMIGVIISFTRLSSDSEILALKASGISLYQMLPPIVVIATVISLITGYFSVKLIPAGDTAMKQLMFQLAKEKIDKGIKEHQFTEALGDLVVYVGRIDKDTGEWQNVWVSDMRGQSVPTITMAKSGKMFAERDKMQVTIFLNSGSLHRSVNNQSEIITFDKYNLSIPLQPPNQDADKISRGAMSMSQLLAMAKKTGTDTLSGREYLIHFHKRLVLPFGCLLLCLIGLPLGLQAGPGKSAVGFPLGLGFYIVYYVLFTVGKRLAELSSLPVGLAMWLPDILFTGIMVFMVWKTASEQPFLPEFIREKIGKIFPFVKKPFQWLMVSFKFHKKKAIENTPPKGPSVPGQSTQKIHGNVQIRVFHFPECEFYNCKNCTIEFNDVETALDSGFKPCRFCKEFVDDKRVS